MSISSNISSTSFFNFSKSFIPYSSTKSFCFCSKLLNADSYAYLCINLSFSCLNFFIACFNAFKSFTSTPLNALFNAFFIELPNISSAGNFFSLYGTFSSPEAAKTLKFSKSVPKILKPIGITKIPPINLLKLHLCFIVYPLFFYYNFIISQY